MGILFGLLAALGWGTGDVLIARATRALGPIQAMFYIQLTGIFAIGVVLAATGDLPPTRAWPWALGLAANLFNLVGTLLFYRAFAVGTLSIVSPVAASFAVVTTVLALLSGERPGALALTGAALVICGVVVVSRGSSAERGPPRGVLEAIGAACCIGFYFWSLGFVSPLLGIAWPVMIGRVVQMLVALALITRRGARPVAVPARLWPSIVGAAALDTLALVCFNIGISGTYVSIVTALASIFSAVTVLLARAFLHERLRPSQWAGVAGLIVGVLLVSL
jgi:drug/metabolite transporter (DMT)-like permease